MWHSQKNLDPFLPVFSHFFMSYFDILGSIFEKCAMTDLPNVIVSMCLVSYNFCMIPQVCSLTFGLNLSGAWGVGGTHLTTFYEPFKMIRLLDLIQIQIISLLLANLQWQLKCTVTQKDNATAGIINLLLFCNKERRCVVESPNVLQNTADVS